MNINQLKYFISAATTHSFTKASDEHAISQTAITQQIKVLEEQLGVNLFDRSKRPLQLTPAGATFLIEAEAIVERMETAIIKTKEASTGMIGSLSFGYPKGFERTKLSNILRQFHLAYPNILINAHRHSCDVLTNSLLNGKYDLIYTWDSTNISSDPDIESKLVYITHMVVALYPTHPLANRKSLTRKELKNENMLYMSPNTSSNSLSDAYFLNLYTQSGYKPNILFYSSDAESILMMVACEEGISILPDYCVNKLDNADNLVFVPLEGEDEVMPIHALWKKSNTNPALLQFIRQILEEDK